MGYAKGVSRFPFQSNAANRDAAIRSAVGIAMQKAKKAVEPEDIESLALSATLPMAAALV
ncbi:hypothetical protein [Dyella sp. S184]|uniref:hypothetical protein n=1 Tax=Dyella sp. S184 TaxID=1641862 RepID=UPI00131DBA20|nr:hypothetical protein [Dyella sp. S184]